MSVNVWVVWHGPGVSREFFPLAFPVHPDRGRVESKQGCNSILLPECVQRCEEIERMAMITSLWLGQARP